MRPAAWADATALLAVHQASVQAQCAADYSPAHMAAWFEGRTEAIYQDHLDHGRIWLAESGGRVLGFVGWQPGELTLLFVAPDAAGQGVGTALLHQGLLGARQGAVEPPFIVSTLNAVAFYRRFGFEPVETLAFTRGAGLQYPVVKMRRAQGPA
jgi:GNAT superfamily N-acetyltransferase